MTFALPILLLFLLGLIALLWLAHQQHRRREITVGALLIWQRVAAIGAAKEARRLDPLLGLLILLLALAIFGAAQPQIAEADQAALPVVVIDRGRGGALISTDAASLAKLGIAPEWPTISLPVDSSGTLARADVEALALAHPERPIMLVSPLELGAWSGRIQQVSPPIEPEGVALARISIEGRELFARSTRVHARFRWQHGAKSGEIVAQGYDLLLTLPPGDGEIFELQRLNAEGQADAAPLRLKARSKLWVFAEFDEPTKRGLLAAFDGALVFEEARDASQFVISRDRDAHDALQVLAGDQPLPDPAAIDSILLAQESAFADWLPPGWLAKMPARGFAPDPLYRALLSVESGTQSWHLIRKKEYGPLETTLDLFDSYRDQAWLPLFVAAAVKETLKRDLLKEGHWIVAEDSAPLGALAQELATRPLPSEITPPKAQAGWADWSWLPLSLALLLWLSLLWRARRWLAG